MGTNDNKPAVRRICYRSDVPVTEKYFPAAMGKIRGSTVNVALACKLQRMTMKTAEIATACSAESLSLPK